MNYAEAQRNPGKHSVGLGIVVVLHVLLGYALISGLAKRVVEVAMKPVETKIIEEIKPPPPPPPENLPPPPKNMPPPPAWVPPPEVNINAPAQAPTITTQTAVPPPTAPTPIIAPPTAAPPAPVRFAAKPAIGSVSQCAPTSDDYPAAARRAETTGVTRVRFTVDEHGKLQKVDLLKSAGSSREHRMLDKVAIDKLSECSFKPGIDDAGKPVGGSFDVDYVWKLD